MKRHTMFPDRNTQHYLDISKSVLKFNMILIKTPKEFVLELGKLNLNFVRNSQEKNVMKKK